MKLDYLITSLNIPNDKYLIVGVSSGPDSMALLDLLKKNCKQSIVCTHINHNIRESSKEEELYLKEYCKENNIIFECKKIDSWEKNNFEAEARTKRYEFYEQILNKYHSHTLFLAHHGDDLIETILMKIIRGSNLEGYAGIKKYSKLDNYTIIRPLLSLTKKDILKYNEENNIKYFIDNSNESTVYTRNRIRKRILPLLKQEDEKVHLKFLKYSDTLQEYYNYVEEITQDKIKNIYKNNIIDIDIFNKEHSLIKKSIIFYILSNIYQNTANIIKDKHISVIEIFKQFYYCLLGSAVWSESIAVFTEMWFCYWGQHLCYCLFNDSIHYCRYSKISHSAVWLGYFYSSYRLWLVLSSSNLVSDVYPVFSEILVDFIYFNSINSTCTFIGFYLFKCHVHISSTEYSLKQYGHLDLSPFFVMLHILYTSISYGSFSPLRLRYYLPRQT